MQLTSIGFGAWAIGGGDWAFGWGSQDDKDSIAAIQKAVDLGVNWVDTAAVYGLGHSEEVVGQALKGISGTKPYVFTKCERRWTAEREIYKSLKAAGVREECEDSLRRLGVDVIDLYQIHWPEPDEDIEEGWEAVQRLKEEGKIRWAGVSNFSVAQMERVAKIGPITSVQPPYSLLNRKIEAEIAPYCVEKGIGIINYSPMVAGLLTGKMTAERLATMPDDDWRKRSANFMPPKIEKNLMLAGKLTEIAGRHGVQTGVVAVAWTLSNPAITAAIVGGRNAAQVEGTAEALRFRLSQDEIAEIDGFVEEKGVAVTR